MVGRVFERAVGVERFTGWMGYWHRWTRVMTRYHLVRPLLHAHHAPEYTARGLAVGMLVALTPTFGAQIAIVMAIWTVLKVVRPAWDFNAVVASAWTFTTNVITVPPAYFIFYLTGQAMMGRWEETGSYADFSQRLNDGLAADAGWLKSLYLYTVNLFDAFGVPMFVGSIPYSILGGVLGYKLGLAFVLRRKTTLSERETARRIKAETAAAEAEVDEIEAAEAADDDRA